MSRRVGIIETIDSELTHKEIEFLIGGLNGRQPFIEYIKRKSTSLARSGFGRQQITAIISTDHRFWSALLKDQMANYDLMREGASGLERTDPFLHYDLDDLFRYCPDPVSEFNIDLNECLTPERVQTLTAGFKRLIENRRKPLPETRYPLSLASFYVSAYMAILRTIINLPSIIVSHKPPIPDFWSKVFTSADCRVAPRVRLFWVSTITAALLFNCSVLITTLISLSASLAAVQLIIPVLYSCLVELLLVPISIVSFIQLGRVVVAFNHGRKCGVAAVRTWRKVRKSFDDVWCGLDRDKREEYFRMIEDIYSHYLITKKEYERLRVPKVDGAAPANGHAEHRIKRWMNLCYMSKKPSRDWGVPAINSWDEVASVSVLVFSLNEKFYYSWDELTASKFAGKTLVEPMLTTLMRAYPDEWENMVQQIAAFIPHGDAQTLTRAELRFDTFNNLNAISYIERWANLRLQTLYNTMEGARKVFGVYSRLAKKFFPAADPRYVDELVKSKVQVILLHDFYPLYSANDPQKLNIDRYFERHSELELKWPRDLVHASKSGAWANVLASIEGEFLMTLDADHSINIEEIGYLPHLLREFSLNTKLDAIQYRLRSFNEPYSWVTKCAAVSEDSWWIQDLRVKSLVGGGGAYGKLVYRVSSIKGKELIQPDSVCEDMLTMARLLTDDGQIKFVEYLQIGQGNDVTYGGLKRKYGRYPVGGIESSFSKLFKEMLLSSKTPWHRKAEALFMVSYYPIQGLIVFASFFVLLTSALDYLPLVVLAFSYLLVLCQSMQLLINLSEAHGYLRGVGKFLLMYFPVNLLYVSYVPHYLEQLGKGLRGHARFNISEKVSERIQDNWDNTYRENRISLNIGCALCIVTLVNLISRRWTLLSHVAYLPFVYNGLVWTIGPFAFIPRRSRLTKPLDIVGPLPYVMIRSSIDAGTVIAARLRRVFCRN